MLRYISIHRGRGPSPAWNCNGCPILLPRTSTKTVALPLPASVSHEACRTSSRRQAFFELNGVVGCLAGPIRELLRRQGFGKQVALRFLASHVRQHVHDVH